jgi:hypothetical protein
VRTGIAVIAPWTRRTLERKEREKKSKTEDEEGSMFIVIIFFFICCFFIIKLTRTIYEKITSNIF